MPSLADLYMSIDWSNAEGTLARWESLHNTKPDMVNNEFRYRWRCALLESALYGETEDRMREARGWLSLAGVWPQVTAYLQANDLICRQQT